MGFLQGKQHQTLCLSNRNTLSSVSRRQLSGLECVLWMNVSLKSIGHSDIFFETLQSVQLKKNRCYIAK